MEEIEETDHVKYMSQLKATACLGRVVPEFGVPAIRELIFKPYRIVYRVNHERRLVEVARYWHAARGTPTL